MEVMGERYYSEFEIGHEQLYLELERLKAENYSLKRQLSHNRNTTKGQSKMIASLQKQLKDGKKHGKKPRREW